MIPSSSRNAHNSNGNQAVGEASVTCAAATTFETEAIELNGNQLATPGGGEDKESCMDSFSLSQVNETKSNHQLFIKVKKKLSSTSTIFATLCRMRRRTSRFPPRIQQRAKKGRKRS